MLLEECVCYDQCILLAEIAGRNINNLRYENVTTLIAESEKELKSLLMNMKEEVKKLLKSQHSKKVR